MDIVWHALSMRKSAKTSQMQIRVSAQQKAAIRRAARRAGMDMSSYVLSRTLSTAAAQFQVCVENCARSGAPSFALAEVNALLAGLTSAELSDAIAEPPKETMSPFLANYIAAMVEYACVRRAVRMPAWLRDVAPLAAPVFGSQLQSLRLHLLRHSPPPFRRRNIFIDATVGDQV
jgi:hypothetical protein